MNVVEAVFSWLLCCNMPLSPEAFVQAISYTLEDRPILTTTAIVDMCFGFVVIDESMNVFRFAHHSLQEYLQNKKPYSAAFCHSRILVGCLNHLSTNDFRISPTRRNKSKLEKTWQNQGTEAVLRCPGSYMCLFWPTHLDLSGDYGHKDPVMEKLLVFFRQSFTEWVETARIMMLPGRWNKSSYDPRLGLLLGTPEYYRYMKLSQPRAPRPNPLSAIIVLGCAEILERGLVVDLSTPCNGVNPLIWACQHRNLDAIKWLLSHGADPNEESLHSLKQPPLLDAVEEQEVAITRVMVSYGTLHTIERRYNRQAVLIWTAHGSNPRSERLLADHATGNNLPKIVRELYPNDVRAIRVNDLLASTRGLLSLKKDQGEVSMYDAITKNPLFTSGLLTEHNARLSDKTAINVALRHQDLSMLDLLLRHGAKVNKQILADWFQSSTSGTPNLDECHAINRVFSEHGIYYQLPTLGTQWEASSDPNAVGKSSCRGRQLMVYIMATWLYCLKKQRACPSLGVNCDQSREA